MTIIMAVLIALSSSLFTYEYMKPDTMHYLYANGEWVEIKR